MAAVVPLLASASLLAWLYGEDRDHRIAALFFDPLAHTWPWQDHVLWKGILHDRATDVVFLVGVGSLMLFGGSVMVGLKGSSRTTSKKLRRRALFLFLSMGLSVGCVALLRAHSPDPSPWFATRFGGTITHGRFFTSIATNGELGRASPGAHASGGFALMATYYCLRESSPGKAWVMLGFGWFLGSLFGATQVVRGAHYPSHNYWSCIVVWIVCTLLYWGPFRGKLEESGGQQDL